MIDNEIPAVNDLLRPIHQALHDSNITPERLAQKLNEELDADETKFFQKDGVVVESRDVVAWKIRQEARKDAHKLLGHYPRQELDLTVNGVIGLKEALDSAETQEPFKPGNDG